MAEHPTPRFADLRQAPKGFSDDFALKALTHTFELPSGENVHVLKRYLDVVPPDASDERWVTDEAAVVGFHNDLADFIADEVKIYGRQLAPGAEQNLQMAKSAYIQRLQAGKARVAEYVHARRSGERAKTPHAAWEYWGLTIGDSERPLDLTDASYANAQSNILVQRGGVGQFVHWRSSALVKDHLQGKKESLERRVVYT